jgi:signal transduction histidine kinase
MLANIAHQWRQPLTELNLTLFSMKKAALNKNDIEVEKLYSDSKNIIQNMSTTIDDFTNFFKPNKAQEYFKIEDSINESLSILEQLLEKEMVSVNVDIEVIEVFGIANELSQVLINLFKNSIDAFINSGVLIREIKVSVKCDGEFASIEFQDNAGGINDKRNIYKIFEPYYTTKHKSQGTGLGLFMSKMICEKGLDGSINVESKKSMTVFTIKIPLRQQNA